VPYLLCMFYIQLLVVVDSVDSVLVWGLVLRRRCRVVIVVDDDDDDVGCCCLLWWWLWLWLLLVVVVQAESVYGDADDVGDVPASELE